MNKAAWKSLWKRIACGVGGSLVTFVANANAQDMADTSASPQVVRVKQNPHAQISLRSGFGMGLGSVYKGLSVTEGSHGFVPVILDVGARVTPHLYVGAYGGFARVIPRHNETTCPETFSCAIDNYRFGVQVDWHVMPTSKWDPYIGFNSGYEILTNHVNGLRPVPTPAGTTTGAVKAEHTDRGWEYLGVVVGSDVRTSAGKLAFGPFLSGSIGSYNVRTGTTRVSVQGTTVSETGRTPVDQAAHALFMLGVRGKLNL